MVSVGRGAHRARLSVGRRWSRRRVVRIVFPPARTRSAAAEFPEHRQEPVTGERIRALHLSVRQLAGEPYDGAPLLENVAAAGAMGEVSVDPRSHIVGQSTLEVGGDKVDELDAGELASRRVGGVHSEVSLKCWSNLLRTWPRAWFNNSSSSADSSCSARRVSAAER